MHNFWSISGICLIFGYLLLAFLLIWFISSFKYSRDSETKKYFIVGFVFKIVCGFMYGLIYEFYYQWFGDTYSYFFASSCLGDVLFQDAKSYFLIFFDMIDWTNYQILSSDISYFPALWDPSKYAVHRFLSPFAILGCNNYYTETICLSVFLYLINWRFFQYVRQKVKCKSSLVFVCIMLVPSVGFWGSGLMKDSFTFTFNYLFIMCFAKIFIDRKIGVFKIIGLILSAYVIIELKPYILYASLAGCLLWFGNAYLRKIKSAFLKFVAAPVIISIVVIAGLFVFRFVSERMGESFQDVDSMMRKASASQMDLKQDYYEGQSFDIGDFDGTLQSAISFAPAAILAGLYRPFIFECNSIVMVFSGLENTILLLLSLYVFFKAGLFYSLKQIISNPFVGFCFLFAIVLSLGIGLSTSNFGALVRFKIPLIPFLSLGWLEILYTKKQEQKESFVAD